MVDLCGNILLNQISNQLKLWIRFQVSKILLHTSGRVLSGAVTVVFGGATVIYDIYRLNSEVQTLAGKGKDGAEDIRYPETLGFG